MTKEQIKKWLINDGQVPEGCENNEYWSHWYDVINRMFQGQSLPIDSVSDFYYLKNGDEIQKRDEYRDEERDCKWFPTGQVGKKYRSDYHYKHRRKI